MKTSPTKVRSVLLDAAPVALATLTRDGCLVRANARFRELVARSEEELAGLPLLRLLHEEDQAAHDAALRGLVLKREPYRQDERYLRPDGTVVWATNEIEHALCAERECMLLAANPSAAQLARAELARDRAEAELRRRDEFLNLLSHELRSPLAAMLVWARLLREGGYEGVDAQRGLEVIERSGRSLERSLEDLVTVSRISGGRLQLGGRCSVDLRGVAQSALDAIRQEAAGKGVKLSRSLPASPLVVNGDAVRLQQVLAHLLGNAVKFTPAGGSVELALSASGSEAVVRVSDSGEGMSESFLPLAFEPFRHGEGGAPTRGHHGLGLGLYIVRHLVALHGGRASAVSAGPGQGSTFTVRLPLDVPAVLQTRADEEASAPAIRHGLRVLVVDDDDDTREALRLILRQSGLEVETADSAADAMAKLLVFRPDVLLSDIAMPGEDGLALIRKVRALEATSGAGMPAAALTAYASSAERDAAIRAGFDWHVPKPVDPPELLNVIAQLARGRRS